MRTLKRLLYQELLASIAFVCLGFLALIFFFDLVEEMGSIGQARYALWHALLFVLLQVPTHVYELLPIATLIGAMVTLARFAGTSEFTIMRVSGLTPQATLRTLLAPGVAIAVLTIAIGDYLAPAATQYAQHLRAEQLGHLRLGRTGVWLKERQPYQRYAVNVGGLNGQGEMQDVRIFEFNNDNHFVSLLQSAKARFDEQAWLLESATLTEFSVERSATELEEELKKFNPHNAQAVREHMQRDNAKVTHHTQLRWPTELTHTMVSAALLKPERMSTLDIYRYMRHLDSNAQNSQQFEIEFWRKLIYPISIFVMLTLALPFAYLHFRSGSIAPATLIGVLAGISFFILNSTFSFIGDLYELRPWLAASLPSILYFLLSLLTFGWVVIRH